MTFVRNWPTPQGYVRIKGELHEIPDLPPTKEQARCCLAHRDELGRPPIGFCSPECERRPSDAH